MYQSGIVQQQLIVFRLLPRLPLARWFFQQRKSMLWLGLSGFDKDWSIWKRSGFLPVRTNDEKSSRMLQMLLSHGQTWSMKNLQSTSQLQTYFEKLAVWLQPPATTAPELTVKYVQFSDDIVPHPKVTGKCKEIKKCDLIDRVLLFTSAANSESGSAGSIICSTAIWTFFPKN